MNTNELKTYQITQIVYLGSGRRHGEHWLIRSHRQPTVAEIRDRLGISVDDFIQVIEFPPIEVWDLPEETTE